MVRAALAKLGRPAVRALQRRPAPAALVTRPAASPRALASTAFSAPGSRALFSSASRLAKPVPADVLKNAKPTDITDAEYHELSNQYLDHLCDRFEELQEVSSAYDFDYSSGVMTLNTPHGQYVINKQPPNKQIWLSSPISGPKRYDWVVISEDQNSKQDTAVGGWIYLRDGSSLNELISIELKIDANVPETSDD